MIKQNPCRFCKGSFYDGVAKKHIPSRNCYCDNRREYEEYLKSQRKHEAGDPIRSLDEIARQEFVMMHGKPKHRAFVMGMTLGTVKKFADNGFIRYAIKKEE